MLGVVFVSVLTLLWHQTRGGVRKAVVFNVQRVLASWMCPYVLSEAQELTGGELHLGAE